jgi:ATP-dependent protease ClpP protease subunit
MLKQVNLHTHIGYGGVTADSFREEMEKIEGDFKMDISCLGGSVIHGLQMYAAADERSKVDTITPHINSIAASFGHMMSLSGSVLPTIVDYGIVLVHKPRIGDDTEGQDKYEKNMLETMYSSALTAMSKKSGVSLERLDELMSANEGEGTWMTAAELYAEGLCQEPIETEIVNKAGMTATLKDAYMMASHKSIPKPKIEMADNKETVELAVHEEVKLALENSLKANVTLKQENDELKAVIQEAHENKVKDFVKENKEVKGYTDEDEEKFVKLGLIDFDLIKSVIGRLPVFQAAPPTPEINKEDKGVPAMSYDEMRKADPRGLQKIAEEQPEVFQKMLDKHLAELNKS